MGIDTASDERELRHGPWERERTAGEAAPRLGRGPSLIVILVLSLGLWAALWAVVSSLAQALLH